MNYKYFSKLEIIFHFRELFFRKSRLMYIIFKKAEAYVRNEIDIGGLCMKRKV